MRWTNVTGVQDHASCKNVLPKVVIAQGLPSELTILFYGCLPINNVRCQAGLVRQNLPIGQALFITFFEVSYSRNLSLENGIS